MEHKVCVVGLGYVGIPLAALLSKHFTVYGYDKDKSKIEELNRGFDRTHEVENIKNFNIEFSDDPAIIQKANFIIVAVPTPVDDRKRPNLSLMESAAEAVGKNLQPGSVVVFESTVYPGATEEVCVPVLEHHSKLKIGEGFKVGYSPERVNPGDKTHTIDKIVKIVSGNDDEALERVAEVYGAITTLHKAPSIKVAEAGKVIENIQRDLNIALMNELALIFDKMGIDTKDVVAAAGTKWNFHKYTPGLVGGHCIGVDPYYLAHKAKQVGYKPQVILVGRNVNEYMAKHVAGKLKDKKKGLILGITFKENVPDIRNSKAKEITAILQKNGSEIFYYDPVAEGQDGFGEQIKEWPPQEKFDAVIVFSPHEEFRSITLEELKSLTTDDAILFDIKGGLYSRVDSEAAGFRYLTL